MFKEKFETKDLILRKAEMSDLNAIYKNFWSSKETAKYMTWKPCENIEEAKKKAWEIYWISKNKYALFCVW